MADKQKIQNKLHDLQGRLDKARCEGYNADFIELRGIESLIDWLEVEITKLEAKLAAA